MRGPPPLTSTKGKIMYGYIYKITNIVNNKVYIGQTTSKYPTKRWREHKYYSRDLDRHLYKSMRKYGLSNFTFEVILKCKTKESLAFSESFCIMLYQSHLRDCGYNIKIGGENHKQTKETRRKISESHKRNNIRPSKEALENATKARLSKPSPLLGKIRPEISKPVVINDFIYPSLSVASKVLGIGKTTLRGRVLSVTQKDYNFLIDPVTKRGFKKSRAVYIDDFIYPSAKIAAGVLSIKIDTLRCYLNGKRNAKFQCGYLNQ